MNNRKNIGIVVAVLGLLMTCCGCLPTLNSLLYLVTMASNRPTSIYNQLLSQFLRQSPRTALSVSRWLNFIFNAPIVCTGIFALVVLIIGIVILVQAKSNGSKPEPPSDMPIS